EQARRLANEYPHADAMRRACAEAMIVTEGPEAAVDILEDINTPRARVHAFRSAAVASVESNRPDLAALLTRRAAVREDYQAESVVIRVIVRAAELKMRQLVLDIAPIAGRWPGAAAVKLGCIARGVSDTV